MVIPVFLFGKVCLLLDNKYLLRSNRSLQRQHRGASAEHCQLFLMTSLSVCLVPSSTGGGASLPGCAAGHGAQRHPALHHAEGQPHEGGHLCLALQWHPAGAAPCRTAGLLGAKSGQREPGDQRQLRVQHLQ